MLTPDLERISAGGRHRESKPLLALDPNLARQFLKALHEDSLSRFRGAFVEVRGKPDGEELGFRRFYPSVAALVKDMSNWPPKQDYWQGMALRKDNRGGKKEDCLAVPACWGDLDCGIKGHKTPNRYKDKEAARYAIEAFSLRPSILVDSGGGLQAHWLLQDPIELTDGNLVRIERIDKGLAQELGGDMGVTDVAHIMRLPGTFNLKLPRNPRPIRIVWCEPERRYTLKELAQYEAKPREYNRTREGAARTGRSEYEVYAQAALAQELAELASTPAYDPGRNNQLNKSAFALGQLIGAGVLDRGQVEAALYGVSVSIGLTEAEIRGTIKSGIEAGMREPRELPKREAKNTSGHEGPEPDPSRQREREEAKAQDPEPLPIVTGSPLWPQEVMTGAAGKFARTYSNYLETPECFLYMDYLTILGHVVSDRITLKSEIRPQPRLYTVNLGESSDTRKTTSINVTEKFFSDVVDPTEINPVWGVGSAEGLAKAFGKNPRVILILDELKALVQKMRIDASVLLPCVNTLFELNRFHSSTKSHDIKIDDAGLCLLGASTLETYRNMFTPQFLDIGFINRVFIVVGDSQKKFPIPKPIPEAEKETLREDLRDVLRFVGEITANGSYAMPIDPQAQEIFDAWYFSIERSTFTKRLDTYGHRLMPLLAVNEIKDRITPEIAQRTVTLLNYQLAARKFADPIDADNAIAKLEERIRRLLVGGPLHKRDLERHGNKSRAGGWAWEAALKNLGKEVFCDWKTKVYSLRPE